MIINQTVSGGSSAPAHYIEKVVDANGKLVIGSTMIDLTGVTDLGDNVLAYAFTNGYWQNPDHGLAGVIDMSSLIKITGARALSHTFEQCSITGLKMPSLVAIYASNAMESMFYRSSGMGILDDIRFDSLKSLIGTQIFFMAFGGTDIASISFPALNANSFSSTYPGALSRIFWHCSNVTMHFPSNLDPAGGSTVISSLSGYPNFDGSNITLLFDLPATVILTGANSVNYERNPKYDTATALAWRVQDTGTAPNFVINWTPYYTSGTIDPAVSDTIYSDSACTTSVTTISSIA